MAEGTAGPNDPHHAQQPTGVADGAELRPLLLLLALDGAVGLWSSLHAAWLQRFFLSQIPLVGLFGLVWGLLGEDTKKGVTARITTQLRGPQLYRVLVCAALVFLVVTLLRSTVEIRALDPASSEVLFKRGGAPRDVETAAAPVDSVLCSTAKRATTTAGARASQLSARASLDADSTLLNKLTTPIEFGVWTWPLGRNIWFYTATHVSPRALRVWPWWRRSLQYPEEFDEVAHVRALPLYPLFRGLKTGCAVAFILREHDSTGVVLASDTLSSLNGLLLTFRDSVPLDTLARRRWDEALRAYNRHAAEMEAIRAGAPVPDGDSLSRIDSAGASGRATLASRWSTFRMVRTRRPLHVGEQIRWEVRGTHRELLAAGEIPLTHDTEILLGNP
jgi:hypothetical protein